MLLEILFVSDLLNELNKMKLAAAIILYIKNVFI
jgi:hypothetical protein